MANTYEKEGATPVEIVRQNANYTALVAQIDKCESGIALDLDAYVFKDADGVPHKCLTDSSGSTAIPVQRIIFADANGAATSNSLLKFDGTWLYIGTIRIGQNESNENVIQVYVGGSWYTALKLEA